MTIIYSAGDKLQEHFWGVGVYDFHPLAGGKKKEIV
jgi:hypothetical protein